MYPSIPFLNHFRLLAQARQGPKRVPHAVPIYSVKVTDVGNPDLIVKAVFHDPQTRTLERVVAGTRLFLDGRLFLEHWTHPKTGDALATLRLNVRRFSLPHADTPLPVQGLHQWAMIGEIGGEVESVPLQEAGRRCVKFPLLERHNDQTQRIDTYLFDADADEVLAQAQADEAPGQRCFVQGLARQATWRTPDGTNRHTLRLEAQHGSFALADPDTGFINSILATEAVEAVLQSSEERPGGREASQLEKLL